jgi:hypothetical protein
MIADFSAASVGCVAANCATHPLETLKVKQVLYKGKVPSTAAVFLHTVRTEGFGSLYKGISAAVVRSFISGAGRLTIYNSLKKESQRRGWLNEGGMLSTSAVAMKTALASFSGCSAQFIAAPIDLIRTRQAAHKGSLQSTPTMLKIATEVVRANGVIGLFSGTSALMSRAVTFNVSQLLAYDSAKVQAAFSLDLPIESIVTHGIASLIAGFAATTASCPSENIKTVMQIQPELSLRQACVGIYTQVCVVCIQ